MTTFWKRLFSTTEGHSLHRPIVGWSCAILFGLLCGLNLFSPFTWLLSATISLLLSWVLSSRWTSLCLVATLFSLTAWHGATRSQQRLEEENRIQTYKETNQRLSVKATIGDDVRIVVPKRGRPYAIFTAKDVTFIDGTPWTNTTLRIRYYGEPTTFPKRGERWQFKLKLYHYPHRDRITGSAQSTTSQHLTNEDQTSTLSHKIGTLREIFSEHLTYGLADPSAKISTQTKSIAIQKEKQRLVEARDTKTTMPIQLTVDPDSYQCVQRKRGKPYYKFKALYPTFIDGTPIQNTTLNVHFYNTSVGVPAVTKPNITLPQPGERWQFNLLFHKSKSKQPKSLTASARPTNAILLSQDSSLPSSVSNEQTDVENEKTRLVEARDTKTFLPIQLTIDPTSYQRIERKRGGPYYKFKALSPTFIDGTPITTTLNINFYPQVQNNPHKNETTSILLENKNYFPQPGERWQFNLNFHKSKSNYPQALTASTRPEGAHLLPKIPIPSSEQDEVEEPFDAITPLRSILLGAHYKLPYDIRQQYADAGIIHIFAISGLHVGILCGLFILILSWLNVQTYLRFFFLFPILIGYLLLTDAPPSATRACIMAIIYCFAATRFRKGDVLTTLLVTADIVMLWNPFWLYHIGALLSFAVMGGILLWYKPLTLFFARCFYVVPNIDNPLPECYPFSKRLRYWLAQSLSITCAAWIVALPLCFYFFQRVSLIGLLLNLFIPFLTIFIVWGGFISACSGFLFPWLSAGINQGCAFLLEMIHITTQYACQIPFATIHLNAPPHGALIICFELLILLTGLYLRVKAIEYLNERLGKIVKRP